MQLGITQTRLSNPLAVMGMVAIAFLGLWVIYGVWLRNADLRPPSQTEQAAGITSCMDRYASIKDEQLSPINVLWSTYYLCNNITSTKLLYEEQVIRNENFVFQRYENTVIMFMVVSITISGVILAGLQLFASYKLALGGKGAMAEGGEFNINFNSMAVKSSVVGVVILSISFAFFLVFVLYVYTFTPQKGEIPSYSRATSSAAKSSGADTATGRSVGQPSNIGTVAPSKPQPAEAPASN
jgi:hypothetical protein